MNISSTAFTNQIEVMNALYKTLEHFFPSAFSLDQRYRRPASEWENHLSAFGFGLGSDSAVLTQAWLA
jgi:hypothetical protein